eukprot:m.152770 g.152770  ORF g.152770 m.152770 type:complete len:80 (-) comp17893_c0_seq57:151-390(-)
MCTLHAPTWTLQVKVSVFEVKTVSVLNPSPEDTDGKNDKKKKKDKKAKKGATAERISLPPVVRWLRLLQCLTCYWMRCG